MPESPSLFARKLRAHRARAGTHGRMTQEALAATLGLSVEAISKYERSQSFIRGDFEHRLIENLGWSAADVADCRADWEARLISPARPAYEVLRGEALRVAFDGDLGAVARAVSVLVAQEMPDIAPEFGVDDDLWVPIISGFPGHGALIFYDGRLVGHWGLQFLDVDLRDRFREGTFVESELSVERLLRPVLPGRYFGYCPVVVIAKGHEAAAPLMLASFAEFLRELAQRDAFLEGIGATAVTAEGRRFCQDLGFRWLCAHQSESDYDMWELPGAALPGSVLLRRHPALVLAYRGEFARKPAATA